MLWGNRNGFFYVLDRATGKFLLGRPFTDLNWASGLDENGRPHDAATSRDADIPWGEWARRHQLVLPVV
jgi:glucose dehydrogenase